MIGEEVVKLSLKLVEGSIKEAIVEGEWRS